MPATGQRDEKPGLYTSGLSPEPGGRGVELGEVVEMTLEDFEDAYFQVRTVGEPESTVRALERWGCSFCSNDHWVLIEFAKLDQQRWKLLGVETVELTPDAVGATHFVSRWMNWWLEARPAPELDWLLRIMLPAFSPKDREKLRGRLER